MLVNCIAYQDGKKMGDISIEDISEYVVRPDCFVWVALKDPDVAELAKMQEEFSLHPLAVEDAQRGDQRAKLEEYGDSLFVIMKTVEMGEHELKVGDVGIFVGSNYVLSVRNHSKQGFSDVRARCEQESHLLKQGAAFALYALLDATVDRYLPIVEAFEEELDVIEEGIFQPGGERENIKSLYRLKRKVVQMRHVVLPLMEAVGKMHGGRMPKLCANTQEYFRDVSDHLQRINISLDAIRETIGTAIQVNLSLVAIEGGEVNKRLAAWAAIFAVATAFAGLWGMNFKNMPELEWQYGYPCALGLMLTVCYLVYRRFKRSGWL